MYHPPAMPSSRPGPIKSGETLGRYTIEGVVGEGGMGVVYRARDTRLGRKVALKVIAVADKDEETAERIKRFLREARSAAALDHPNAVSLFDVGEDEGVSFIAMELVNGRSLRTYVGAAEPDVATRLRWLAEVASALAAAHRARLIHRDIKPENVMIRDDGRVKVLDFGLARRAPPPPEPAAPSNLPVISSPLTDETHSTLTAVGTLLGTPQYMAPEQIRSDPLDGRADQFSWGVLAYELLAGELPWTGMGLNVMARILTDEAQPLRERNPEIPEEAAAVVTRALQKAPGDRFASMDEVIQALEPFTDVPVYSGPMSSGGRLTIPRTPMPPPPENITQRSADHAASSPSPATSSKAPPKKPVVQVVDDPVTQPEAAAASPSEPPRARGLVGVVAAISLLAGAVGTWRTLRGGTGPPPAVSASASAPAPAPTAAPTAVTELPVPRSASPEAIAAYRAGLAELRYGGTREAFERAATLDPSLAVAHLQYAVDATESEFADPARVHLRKAQELRAQLSERDQLLLDALEPVLLRQPANWGEASARLARAVERFPGDAQLWYERGWFAQSAEGLEASARHLERAIELDPSYGQAMSIQAEDLAYLGRFAEARKVLDRCAAIGPAFVSCPLELSLILEAQGACDEEEALARQLIAANPTRGLGHEILASALAARGRPEAAVREALKLKWAGLDESERREVEPADTLLLDLLTGDFAAAEQHARAIEARGASSRREADHARPALWLAQIFTETGRLADAAREADAFLSRRDAWQPDPRSEDFAMGKEATPRLLAVTLHAGKLPRQDFAAKRAEWVQRWERKASHDFKGHLWAHGHASTVETADEAREALGALPKYEPLPVFYPHTLAEAWTGQTFFLGGRADDGVKWLERATRTCRALELPVDHTRAHLWLGAAREARSDKEGACAAYRVVRDRWGKAKPRSVTGEKAIERIKALGCGP
jgi:serine/threonine-protein kinase